MVSEPILELDRRVRILKPRVPLCSGERGGTVLTVALHRMTHQHAVEEGAGVVDPLIEHVGVPLNLWDWERGESVVDGAFALTNIAFA
ncbi:hypothetical protein [Glutamicibacter sp. X7]